MGETPEELEGGKALKLKPHPPTPRFSCSTWEHAVFNLLLYVLYQVFMPPVFMNHLLDIRWREGSHGTEPLSKTGPKSCSFQNPILPRHKNLNQDIPNMHACTYAPLSASLKHTYQVSLLGSESHSYLPNLTPDTSRKMYCFILDLTPGALIIIKYCTIGCESKSHSSPC